MTIADDYDYFVAGLELEAALHAEQVVDDADSLAIEDLGVQTIVDEILALQWSQRDISPADWYTIAPLYRESVQAHSQLDSIARDTTFALLVAQGDG